MDEYKASVQGVDDALARLNATLASYKTLDLNNGRPKASQRAKVNKTNAATQDRQADLSDHDRASIGFRTFQVVTKVSGLSAEYKTWWAKSCESSSHRYGQVSDQSLCEFLICQHALSKLVEEQPYSVLVHLELAWLYMRLGYPDLAAGSAYKALLLTDAIRDDSDEYHDQAYGALKEMVERVPVNPRIETIRKMFDDDPEQLFINAAVIDPGQQAREAEDLELMTWCEHFFQRAIYKVLIKSLMLCGDLSTAGLYMNQSYPSYEFDDSFAELREELWQQVAKTIGKDWDDLDESERSANNWPSAGQVRREIYPWNLYEPDRFAEIDKINDMMRKVAPKLEVSAVELPALANQASSEVSKQLGVVAREDIVPGETVLNEVSLLTVNNRLQDTLCDACSSDLPSLKDEGHEAIAACPDCEVIYCSQECYDAAMEHYHPAVCERDVEAIMKDPDPKAAADSLYCLLVLRCFALAETRQCQPLDLEEIKYIWGDFTPENGMNWSCPPKPGDLKTAFAGMARTLPFSFEYNVRLPFHMLEKMDIDIFANPHYDVWTFNTLYAKFRGTASARLSGGGGSIARGPDVCAVHPMWCMANHSCDPNVSWEWGGSITLAAREQRVEWIGRDSKHTPNEPGIRKGEEVLNHYCDLELPVKDRREWASGALGGDCLCERCVWEAKQQV